MVLPEVYRTGQREEEGVNRPRAGLEYYREYGHEFRSLGAGRYEAPSRKTKGKRYEINLNYETCTCPDYTRRNPYNTPPEDIRPCAHIYGMVIAVSKPAPIPSRERTRFPNEVVWKNIQALGGE